MTSHNCDETLGLSRKLFSYATLVTNRTTSQRSYGHFAVSQTRFFCARCHHKQTPASKPRRRTKTTKREKILPFTCHIDAIKIYKDAAESSKFEREGDDALHSYFLASTGLRGTKLKCIILVETGLLGTVARA